MLESLTADDFRPYVGHRYRLAPTIGDPVDAVLVAVSEHPSRPGDARAPFDIVFRATPATVLGQGMFRVERDGGDTLDIFIVPMGPDPGVKGMLFQAVFG